MLRPEKRASISLASSAAKASSSEGFNEEGGGLEEEENDDDDDEDAAGAGAGGGGGGPGAVKESTTSVGRPHSNSSKGSGRSTQDGRDGRQIISFTCARSSCRLTRLARRRTVEFVIVIRVRVRMMGWRRGGHACAG
jgi:hypothetical protein